MTGGFTCATNSSNTSCIEWKLPSTGTPKQIRFKQSVFFPGRSSRKFSHVSQASILSLFIFHSINFLVYGFIYYMPPWNSKIFAAVSAGDKFLQAWETAHLKGSKEADGGGWRRMAGWMAPSGREIQRIKTESRQNGSLTRCVMTISLCINWLKLQ